MTEQPYDPQADPDAQGQDHEASPGTEPPKPTQDVDTEGEDDGEDGSG